MLIYNINNYDDFKYLFGIETHDNGAKSRKNKILLNHLKSKALIKWCREHNDNTLLRVRNMADLKKQVLDYIQEDGLLDNDKPYEVKLINNSFYSSKYRTDHWGGVCEDFDKRSIRYINCETNRTFKMKAGKFITAIIKETTLGQALSHSVINWLSEEFTADWETYTSGQSPEVTLHVDDNFKKIYDPYFCKDFNSCSCMVGKERHAFYEDSVEAKAAYLTDSEGFVLSRAILFTDVTDQNGKKWRLLERQYSKESSEVLKRLLIDLLIKKGEIDGYKQVGAGCSESRAFVANDGTSLADYKFSIECDLETYDCLSYQDSFKFYDYDKNVAYNYFEAYHDYELDTTNYSLDGDDDDDNEEESQYDEYHDYDCDEVRLCYQHGSEIYVDVDNLDDFKYVEGIDEFHHKDDVVQCLHCGKWILKVDAGYNDTEDNYFCGLECEADYKKEHWYYSEFEDEYYPAEGDITTVSRWDEQTQGYKEVTISFDALDSMISQHKAFGFEETWFIASNAIAA